MGTADERWHQLVSVQEEARDDGLALPRVTDRRDGSRRENSPRAIDLARALAWEDHWERRGEGPEGRLAA